MTVSTSGRQLSLILSPIIMGRTTPSSLFSYIPHLYELGEVMQVAIGLSFIC
jgi:hypothetical protein